MSEPKVNRATVIEWLDANEIEVTHTQLAGLFSSAIEAAQAQEDAEACADTRRLNFLESRGCDGWIARMSTTGRGYRLHQSHGNPFATARDAIDAAIAAQQGDVA